MIERYQRNEELFARFRAHKYQVRAAFGAGATAAFDDLSGITKDIFMASYRLGRYYWPRQGRVDMSDEKFKRHLKEMHAYENILGLGKDEGDPIEPRIRDAVKKMESVMDQALSTFSVGLFGRFFAPRRR